LFQINDVSNNDLPLTENENNIFKTLQQENDPLVSSPCRISKNMYKSAIQRNGQNASTSSMNVIVGQNYIPCISCQPKKRWKNSNLQNYVRTETATVFF